VGCLILLIGLLSARLAIIVLALFTDDLSRAFDSWFLPFLGFFLLPWTTLVYTLLWTTSRHVDGVEWAFVALAFLLDIGVLGGGGRYRRRD
jgi:hypothetical protein